MVRMMNNRVGKYDVDRAVFSQYAGLSLPRHVSYPMPTWWDHLGGEDAAEIYDDAYRGGSDGLSLYVHIPFCERLCKFCACNRIIIGPHSAETRPLVDRYLDALEQEIARLGQTMGSAGRLRQIHWGGGSPTYLAVDQIERIHSAIDRAFDLASDAEIAMEVDPRTGTAEKLQAIHRLGFSRISLGIQDFDETTQQHVRRVQPFDMVREYMHTCRSIGFPSINFDLIYGMPYQTPETIRKTVELTMELAPDRIAFYHYAQIPDKIATQRGMNLEKLPSSEEKLDMFLNGLELFEAAGYEFVGLDHFAKCDEALVKSLREGTIQRNFQGMTTGGDLHLLGAGCSSISHLKGIGFLQNVKDVDQYVETVECGRSPVERGKRFTPDDCIRQAVLGDLYCTATVRPDAIAAEFNIDFAAYFADELQTLRTLAEDGLVRVYSDGVIHVTKPLGRVLMRNIAAVFDAYLDKRAYCQGERATFSVSA